MLVPLRDEHSRKGEARLIVGSPSDVESVVRSLYGRRANLLVIEDVGKESCRSRYASPFVERAADSNVLLGWLQLDRQALAAYVDRAVTILRRRDDEPNAVVLLAPRERRYLALLDEIERARCSPDLRLLRWSAERIRRTPLIDGLRLGSGAILYSGHGNASGWFAYGGINIGHLCSRGPWLQDQTSALVFSLSCNTGQAPHRADETGKRRGLADQTVTLGVAGAVLAPLGNSLHENSRLLATGLTRALGRGCRRLHDILAEAITESASLDGYFVVGDPGLHAASARGAALRGGRVFAPGSDEENLLAMREACAGSAPALIQAQPAAACGEP